MKDVYELLRTKKLNTTAYHPQCDGMVERFNRTLKTMLRKHAVSYGPQWDRYLAGVLWAYRNTPHDSTKEKLSFLLFGVDCRSPTDAAFLPTTVSPGISFTDYRQELMVSLHSARTLATQSIQEAQRQYKKHYDKHLIPVDYQVGDWVLVHFPQDESGRLRNIFRPWHGPYRTTALNGSDVIFSTWHYSDASVQSETMSSS